MYIAMLNCICEKISTGDPVNFANISILQGLDTSNCRSSHSKVVVGICGKNSFVCSIVGFIMYGHIQYRSVEK